jgi:hypothetical protein
MRRQRIKNFFGTIVAFVVIAGFTGLIILAEHQLDITKAHTAGGGG